MKVFDIDQTLIPTFEFYSLKKDLPDWLRPNLQSSDMFQIFKTEEAFRIFSHCINKVRLEALQSKLVTYIPISNNIERIILISDFFPSMDVIEALESIFHIQVVSFVFDIESLESNVDDYELYDDSPKRIEKARKAKQKYIIDQPWNKHLQIGQRINPFYQWRK